MAFKLSGEVRRMTLVEQIVAGEIEAVIVYESAAVIAFTALMR
jgi:diadenosine tetraphosphate (Ap4A) HIT family hydrolase